MVTDHNHLVGVFHQQPVITGHSQMTALTLCSLRFEEVLVKEAIICTRV